MIPVAPVITGITFASLLLLLLLYDMDGSCHRLFLPGTSLEPAVIPTAQASSLLLLLLLLLLTPYGSWSHK